MVQNSSFKKRENMTEKLRDRKMGATEGKKGDEDWALGKKSEPQKKSGRSCDRPERFSETICSSDYAARRWRNIRRVLIPNGSSRNAPAASLITFGTHIYCGRSGKRWLP
jgi:hypothetical protein